jgi:hypothetical protein
MSPERQQKARAVFEAILGRPEAERLAAVEAACGADSDLYQEVLALWAAHEQSQNSSFLEADTHPTLKFGRYHVIREIGRGGMGVVLEAVDPLIGRKIALKVIHLDAFADRAGADFAEARVAGRLSHPGIVIIYDVGEEEGRPYIAMELVEGPTLFQLMKAGRIPEGMAIDFLRQAASAIDHANSNGVIHRDLKPANVMLHRDTTIKITDFGISKMAGARHRTATGLVMGTPSYMSPEQIRAMPLDGRSDQFALAAIAYELLTGSMSFPGETMAAMYLIVEGKRPSARALNADLPPAVDDVFFRALAKEAGQRYASSTEFVEALATALVKPVMAPVDPPAQKAAPPVAVVSPKPRRSTWIVAAGLLAAAALGGAAALVFRNSPAKITAGVPPPAVEQPKARETTTPPPVDPGPPLPPEEKGPKDLAEGPRDPVKKPAPKEVSASELRERGQSSQKNGNLQDAEKSFREAAKAGDSPSMVQLGSLLATRREPQADSEALNWFHKAAAAGNPVAMDAIGHMHESGRANPVGTSEAAKWYAKASDAGNAAGTYDLGRIVEKQNPAAAADLYRKAAEAGDVRAQSAVARLRATARTEPRPRASAGPIRVVVNGATMWTRAGVDVQAGDRISIYASGSVRVT